MKKLNSQKPLLFLALLFLFFSCKKDILTTVNDEYTNLKKQAKENLTVQKVSYKDFLKTVRSEQLGTLKEVLFRSEVTNGVNNFSVKVNSEPDVLLLMDQIKKVKTNNFTTYTVPLANKTSSLKEFKNLLISEKGNETIAILITYKPDESWIKAHDKGLYVPFHGKIFRKVIDLKANKSISKAGGISVATVFCQFIQVVAPVAVSCVGTGSEQHWPGQPCQLDGQAGAPHYEYVTRLVKDCQDDGTPLPPELWRQAPVEVTPLGPIVNPPTEPTPPPPPCLAGIDGTCDGSTPPPPPPISLPQFLIEELAITDSNHHLLLNFNTNLSSHLFVYLQSNGYSQENKDFARWAIDYFYNNTNVDFNDLFENISGDNADLDFDINSLNQPQVIEFIPTKITLNNGTVVNLVFGITEDGKSALQKVNIKLITALKIALENLPQNITINSLFIKASTNGVHGPNSNHPRGIALDISRINGIKMISSGVTPEIISLQQSLDNLPNIRENFGPSFKHKNGLPWTISDHQDHIHFSINL